MNVIIIDSDCRKYYSDTQAVRTLLAGVDCQVNFLDAEHLPQIDADSRCVILTALYSGVKKYHRDLIMSNPQVRCWTVSVLNVNLKSEQAQIIENIEPLLAESRALYSVVFDEADSLAQTAEVCRRPINLRKTCLVVSADLAMAQRCGRLLGAWLENWDVIASSEPLKQYVEADAILAVGTAEDDFTLPAPYNGMGRTFVWREHQGIGAEKAGVGAYEKLVDCGWNLNSSAQVFCSSLILEELAQQVESGEIPVSTLRNNENFVMWDEYGLPIRSSGYTDEVMRDFLRRKCCFADIAEQIKS